MLATASGVFAALYAYFQEDADMGINEGGLCAGAALLLGASFLRKPLGCAIAPPTTTPRGQASRVITSPALALERCGRMSQHLPAETETKSLVSALATGLRQEAELGDVGIQIEKATLGRDKQHPEEEKEIEDQA